MNGVAEYVDIGSLIVRSPEIKGGSPRIRGSGVTVQRVVGWYRLGLGPEEIARKIGHVPLQGIYAALAYYHANSQKPLGSNLNIQHLLSILRVHSGTERRGRRIRADESRQDP